MGLNIKKLWTTRSMPKFLKNNTWQRVLAGFVYFLIFSAVLSSSLFVSKLDLKVGEPSPQLIQAPWDKDIEDREKWYQDQEAAARSTPPVYMADEEYISSLAGDLSKAFLALNEVAASGLSDEARVTKLRQTAPFEVVPDGAITGLIHALPEDLVVDERIATEIIIGNARNLDAGATTNAEVGLLQEEMKQDIQASELSEEMKVFLQTFIETKVNQPTLVLDEEATKAAQEAARAAVKLEVHRYKADQKIVGQGDIVDEETYRVLEAYGLVDVSSPWRSTGGVVLIVLISMAVLLIYILQHQRKVLTSTGKMVLIGLTVTLVLAFGKGIIAIDLGGAEYNALVGMLIPVAWATMTVAILVDVGIALLVSVVLAVFSAILVDPTLSTAFGLQVGLAALFGGVVGVHSVSHLSQRSDLARAGIFVAGANVIAISGIALMSNMRLSVWVVGVLIGVVNGLISSALTVGTLHWFESGFRITSAVRLLELSNPNRPLLKRLLMEAPGTYHHSILVGNLAEAAAEAVRADATLVRVGAMYHDIGKLKRPYFFIENQFAQDNPHDKIAPTLSSLIITSHVKDGLELAKENKLPEQIQDIIAQHHGDSLVTFFYHKAREGNEDVPEEAFHYDAPRPQSKEAALVCLADSVEAAVRAMSYPTPGRIEGLVRRIIKDKLNDGQLDRCDLTFHDLDRIAVAFVRVLTGIFHSRVEYPTVPAQRSTGRDETGNAETNSAETIGADTSGTEAGGTKAGNEPRGTGTCTSDTASEKTEAGTREAAATPHNEGSVEAETRAAVNNGNLPATVEPKQQKSEVQKGDR